MPRGGTIPSPGVEIRRRLLVVAVRVDAGVVGPLLPVELLATHAARQRGATRVAVAEATLTTAVTRAPGTCHRPLAVVEPVGAVLPRPEDGPRVAVRRRTVGELHRPLETAREDGLRLDLVDAADEALIALIQGLALGPLGQHRDDGVVAADRGVDLVRARAAHRLDLALAALVHGRLDREVPDLVPLRVRPGLGQELADTGRRLLRARHELDVAVDLESDPLGLPIRLLQLDERLLDEQDVRRIGPDVLLAVEAIVTPDRLPVGADVQTLRELRGELMSPHTFGRETDDLRVTEGLVGREVELVPVLTALLTLLVDVGLDGLGVDRTRETQAVLAGVVVRVTKIRHTRRDRLLVEQVLHAELDGRHWNPPCALYPSTRIGWSRYPTKGLCS